MAVHGIPFLKYFKKQPLALGRSLRQKAAWQAKKWDQRVKLVEETLPLSQQEDAWDDLIARQLREESVSDSDIQSVEETRNVALHEEPESWISAYLRVEAGLAQKVRDFDRRNLETGRRMYYILKQERELAAKEKAEVESKKYEKRVLRRVDKFLATETAASGRD
jgi:hypothetical protein